MNNDMQKVLALYEADKTQVAAAVFTQLTVNSTITEDKFEISGGVTIWKNCGVLLEPIAEAFTEVMNLLEAKHVEYKRQLKINATKQITDILVKKLTQITVDGLHTSQFKPRSGELHSQDHVFVATHVRTRKIGNPSIKFSIYTYIEGEHILVEEIVTSIPLAE